MEKINKFLTLGFIIVELLIYISFMIMDVFNFGDTVVIKYLSICLIIIFLMISLFVNKKIKWCYFIGLIFTLIADTFLLLLDSHYYLGLLSFNIVQTLYFLPLKERIGKWFNIQLLARGIIFILCGILALTTSNIDVFLSASYITFFILNIITISLIKNKGDLKLLLIGLIIFLMCDLSVGLYNLSYYFDIPYNVDKVLSIISENLMWFFYLPSQVIISIYAKREYKKSN
jgi:hypothetical protein